ncbi:hypothetical protein AAEU29_11135 [Pseudoalteromonas sp. SSM20]|uniref:hypothetical protein n=1 Tax=Pseudoalteromonas sp. SSM20 TaxID=3139394 RepID=UPI003BAA83B1
MNKPIFTIIYSIALFAFGALAHALFAEPNTQIAPLKSDEFEAAAITNVQTNHSKEPISIQPITEIKTGDAVNCEAVETQLNELKEQVEEQAQHKINLERAKALRKKLYSYQDENLAEQRMLDKIGALSDEIAGAIGLSREEFEALNKILLEREQAEKQNKEDYYAQTKNSELHLSSSDKKALLERRMQIEKDILQQFETQVVSALSPESVEKYRNYEKQKVQNHYDTTKARRMREVSVFIDGLEEYKKLEIADYINSQVLDLDSVKLGAYQGRMAAMKYDRPLSQRELKAFLKQTLTSSQYEQYIANQKLMRLRR